MFHVVSRANRARYARQLASMHEHRPEMFEGRPGGGPEAAAGRLGRDRFDDDHALYVMALDSFGEIECCVRLRPAAEGSIIGSYYSTRIDPREPAPDAPGTLEMSYYYARGGARGEAGAHMRAQLRLAILATAAEAGADRILSVCETVFWPAAERCGWRARRIGPAFPYCQDGEAVIYEIASGPAEVEAFRAWLEAQPASDLGPEAGEMTRMAGKLGPVGLDLVTSLARRIAEIEAAEGADAAMALAERLSRAAEADEPEG